MDEAVDVLGAGGRVVLAGTGRLFTAIELEWSRLDWERDSVCRLSRERLLLLFFFDGAIVEQRIQNVKYNQELVESLLFTLWTVPFACSQLTAVEKMRHNSKFERSVWISVGAYSERDFSLIRLDFLLRSREKSQQDRGEDMCFGKCSKAFRLMQW